MLPSITLFSLGGTIAMTPAADAAGVQPTLTAEDLLAAVPRLAQVAEIEARPFRQLPSTELTVDDLIALAAEIETAASRGAQGVVITQGTDTMEETAFALDLMLRPTIPVVVTGAMRNPSLPGADGPANLLAAVRVAADDAVRGCGVVVVMNDEIHAANLVAKAHTSSPAAFRSPGGGPLGVITEDRVALHFFPGRRPHVPVVPGTMDQPVALLTAALGEKPRLVASLLDAGYKGLVVAGMGGGHVPASWVEPLSNIAREIPTVLASRTGNGETLQKTYDFPGAEISLLSRGLIPAGRLQPLKARLLLALLLRSSIGSAHYFDVFADFNN